ncbi:MAG: glutathione S-transferase [Rhizobiales bacterium]|nr:glutathione S-transferase [Hyphomicrobiales bacterium]
MSTPLSDAPGEALPLLYSFRRCPYAMRARLAVLASGVRCELREIVLRDKAPAFLAASPKGTVPVVVTAGGDVIEQSLDVMHWALEQNDPGDWLSPDGVVQAAMDDLIAECDGPFKDSLDRYKYANRYEGADPIAERAKAEVFLRKLEERLAKTRYLCGEQICLADMAIAPFVRQFANVDRAWFDGQDWPRLIGWLEAFLASERFEAIFKKYPQWHAGDAPTVFP